MDEVHIMEFKWLLIILAVITITMGGILGMAIMQDKNEKKVYEGTDQDRLDRIEQKIDEIASNVKRVDRQENGSVIGSMVIIPNLCASITPENWYAK